MRNWLKSICLKELSKQGDPGQNFYDKDFEKLIINKTDRVT